MELNWHSKLFSEAFECRFFLIADRSLHDSKSPLLLGQLLSDDKITERKMHSCLERQMDLGF